MSHQPIRTTLNHSQTAPLHIIVMGVSGTGKTTVADLLTEQLNWPYAEADAFHPEQNKRKMASGIPLTDDDRWAWLADLNHWMVEHDKRGESTIVTCSALKRAYRDVLRRKLPNVVFLHLTADVQLIEQRMTSRKGHFMPPTLLPSQFATLEQLEEDEAGVTIDVHHTPDEIVEIASTLWNPTS